MTAGSVRVLNCWSSVKRTRKFGLRPLPSSAASQGKVRHPGAASAAAPAPRVDEVPGYPIATPPPPPEVPPQPEDLSQIKGIGPVYQAKLADAGIVRFDELADSDAMTVAARIEAPVSRVQRWIDEARRLVR